MTQLPAKHLWIISWCLWCCLSCCLSWCLLWCLPLCLLWCLQASAMVSVIYLSWCLPLCLLWCLQASAMVSAMMYASVRHGVCYNYLPEHQPQNPYQSSCQLHPSQHTYTVLTLDICFLWKHVLIISGKTRVKRQQITCSFS